MKDSQGIQVAYHRVIIKNCNVSNYATRRTKCQSKEKTYNKSKNKTKEKGKQSQLTTRIPSNEASGELLDGTL